MIRIIEHGFKYHMETKCLHCGCRFEYDWEDVLKTSSYGTVGVYTTYTYPTYEIHCPECGTRIILPFLSGYPKDDNPPTITCLKGTGVTCSYMNSKDINEGSVCCAREED